MDADRVNRWRLAKLRPFVWIGLTLALLGFGLWPLLRTADPDASLRWEDGRLLGDVAGYVAGVDPGERRLDVASSRFGFHSVAVVLTEDTTVMVHGKHGALGDLWKDMPVRVAYEVRGDVRMAHAIEVVSGDRHAPGAGVPPAATPPAPATAVSATVLPAPAGAAEMPQTVLPPATAAPAEIAEPAAPVQVAPPSAVVPAMSAEAPRPAGTVRGKRAANPAAVVSPPVGRAAGEAGSPGAAPAPRASRSTAADRRITEPPTDRTGGTSETEMYGSDAVDWLLKGGPRR